MNTSTFEVTTLAGLSGTSGALDGIGAAARFNFPRSIVLDSTMANLYVVDYNNHAIRKIDVATGTVSTFAGVLNSASYSDGVGNLARFYYPSAITTDGTNLYVHEMQYCILRKIHIASKSVTTMMGGPSPVTCNDIDGTFDVAKVARPTGIHWSAEGLFVIGSHGVRRMR